MKKFKILFISLAIILLAGCSGNYDININKDLSVEENLYLTIDNSLDMYEKTLKIFDDNNIDKNKYKIKQTSDEIVIEYKEKYSTLDEYILKSKLYHQLVDEITYNKNDNYIDIYIDQYVKTKNENDENMIGNINDIDLLQINIKTPFKTLLHNSDSFNENVYSWTIDKKTTHKKIIFQFSKKLKSISYAQIIMILVLFLCILTLIINLIKKYRNSQKI